jgi:hypothetical protein
VFAHFFDNSRCLQSQFACRDQDQDYRRNQNLL